ncbi:hypothetical protein MBLNU230_g4171t1 [Neophaeotheca triangularis]
MVEPLQTADAAIGVATLAVEAVRFLNRVKNADKTALEISNRVQQLADVLRTVNNAIHSRYSNKWAETPDGGSEEVVRQVQSSIEACNLILVDIRNKVGGYDGKNPEQTPSLIERLRIVFRHPSIARAQGDIEAHISLLQTSLGLLQFYANADAEDSRAKDHADLADIIQKGFERLGALKQARKDQAEQNEAEAEVELGVDHRDQGTSTETLAFRRLEMFLKDADRVRICGRDTTAVPSTRLASKNPHCDSTKSLESLESHSEQPTPPELEDEEFPRPLPLYSNDIVGYYKLYQQELAKDHFGQAERNLNEAIKSCELREQYHHVPFERKFEMREQLANISLKLQKWSEAVNQIRRLISDLEARKQTDPEYALQDANNLDQARLNQLLAKVYYDRHLSNTDNELSPLKKDIEIAQERAERAFAIRYKALFETGRQASHEEREAYSDCIHHVARILDSQGRTVNASSYRGLLPGSGHLGNRDPFRPESPQSSDTQSEFIVSDFDRIIRAIKKDDLDKLEALLQDHSVDINGHCSEGKTPLMHAVLNDNTGIVLKLRDPTGAGADIDHANDRGTTALHLAAANGKYKMVNCLLECYATDSEDNDGKTALMLAVQNGYPLVIEAFSLRHPPLLLQRDKNEWSLLHHAIDLLDTRVTTKLLDLAPDLCSETDPSGMTALHMAVKDGKILQVKALLEHRHHCDVNAPDNAETTNRNPLFFAAEKTATTKERREMVELLVQHGAQIDPLNPPRCAADYEELRAAGAGQQRRSSLIPSRRDSAASRTTSSSTGSTILNAITRRMSRER